MTRAADSAVANQARAPAAIEAARAKINLALHVLGRRSDGYHEIESLVVFAEAGDTLAIEDGPPGIDIGGAFAHQLIGEPVEQNLVHRAIAAFSAVAGAPVDTFRVLLNKNLPVGAGLGGGSADAAAMLRLLARRVADPPLEADLSAIAGHLGADVPMCLRSEPLVARGRGERIEPMTGLPPVSIVLIWPGVSVSTASVFSRLSGVQDPAMPNLPSSGFSNAAELARWLRQSRNSLEDVAREDAPVIGHALQALIASPGCMFARMSGSGSSVYGLFPFHDAAAHAARVIRSAEPGWWTLATTSGGSG